MPAGRRSARRDWVNMLLLLMVIGAAVALGIDPSGTEPSLALFANDAAGADTGDSTDDAGAVADPVGPGTLVSTAPVDWAGLSGIERLVYRTRGIDGGPTTASALVRLPAGVPPASGWPVVAWTHGTSGMGQDCGLLGSPALAAGDAPTVARFTDAGYAVVIPDYLGLSPDSPGPHPYLHGRTEATATIDAVRAARHRFDTLSSAWVVAGYSQGGHAALATGHLAPGEAPELDLRGIVALAPTSNVEEIYARAAPQMPALPFFPRRNFVAVLNSLRATHPQLNLDAYLSPIGRELVDRVATACYAQWPDIIGGRSPGELLARPLAVPEVETALREHLAVPTSGYHDPILLIHGSRDTTVPLTLTEMLIDQFARAGTDYELRVLDAQHQDLGALGGIDLAVAFVQRVLPAG